MYIWNKEIIFSAFATAIVFGGCLLFDQKLMGRAHTWLNVLKMCQFPVKREDELEEESSAELVYCLCWLPKYITKWSWVECCDCKEWFHRTCVNVPGQTIDTVPYIDSNTINNFYLYDQMFHDDTGQALTETLMCAMACLNSKHISSA